MVGLLRLLPRHWDGKRLLQFLTGLVLLAMTFGGPAAASPLTPPAAATSGAATSNTATSAAAASGTATNATARSATATTATATTATVRASAADTAAATDTAASAAAVQRQTERRHDASGVAHAVPAVQRAVPAGVVPGAHGSRAPPRA